MKYMPYTQDDETTFALDPRFLPVWTSYPVMSSWNTNPTCLAKPYLVACDISPLAHV